MALKQLEIWGYRGFKKKGRIYFSTPESGRPGSGLTIITGPNNSGKSSILECLRARHGHQPPSFSSGVRNASIEYVEISYTFDEHTETIRSIEKGSSETKIIGKMPHHKIFTLPSRRTFEPYFGKSIFSREFHIDNSMLPPQRSAILHGFASRLFNIIQEPSSKNAFNQLLAKALGFMPEWSIDLSEQGQYFLKFFSANHSHSSDGLGEGIVSIFSIIDSLYDSNPGDIIVIDEPELSLHPALQKRLSKLFIHMSIDRQIIISTHSPYFVDPGAIQNGARLARIISTVDGTEVFQLKNEALESFKTLSFGNLYNPHVLGLDAREFFFLEDGVVLTEGQEDVLLFPYIIEQLKESIPGDFFGWGAGGAGNIKHLCKVLQGLGFKRVSAILDGDKQAEARELHELYPDYLFSTLPADDIRTKKPRKAIEGKDGILDDNFHVRNEHIEAMKSLLAEIRGYMTNGKISADAAHSAEKI